jgi:hypothetical protein
MQFCQCIYLLDKIIGCVIHLLYVFFTFCFWQDEIEAQRQLLAVRAGKKRNLSAEVVALIVTSEDGKLDGNYIFVVIQSCLRSMPGIY